MMALRPVMKAVLPLMLLAGMTDAQEGATDTAKQAEVRSLDKDGEITCRDQGKKLCIGVRSHSRPFSYEANRLLEVITHATPGPLGRAQYTGYVVKICDAVLTELIATRRDLTIDDVGVFDIDKARRTARRAKLEGDTDAEAAGGGEETALEDAVAHTDLDMRFRGGVGNQFDILCDPATITNERRNGLILSAPIYLTGISYVTLAGRHPPAKPCESRGLIGLVGDTTAQSRGLSALINSREVRQHRATLISVMNGQEVCVQPDDPYAKLKGALPSEVDAPQKSPNVLPVKAGPERSPVRVYATHAEAALAFCNGDFHYYLGDLEIVRANAAVYPGCDTEDGIETFTEDRYAIFGRAIQRGAIPRAAPLDSAQVQQVSARAEDMDPPPGAVLPGAFGGTADAARKQLVADFFEILARKSLVYPSLMDQAYDETFRDAPKSEKLEAFFRIMRGNPHNP